MSSSGQPDAVILIRDSDNVRTRDGLEQARSAFNGKFPIVIGLAHPKRECWVLAGFEARDQRERESLDRLRRELGFNPSREGERLNGRDGDPRDAKRVLAALTSGGWEREQACWMDAPLTTLAERGRNVGLADYLDEARRGLASLFR